MEHEFILNLQGGFNMEISISHKRGIINFTLDKDQKLFLGMES